MNAPPERPLISIVLPAHNEVGLLGSTVTNLITGFEVRDLDYELIIIENGSRDGTLRLARLLDSQFAAVRVLTLTTSDYGAALAAGFAAASGPVVVNFDVDYYDFSFLDTALAQLSGGADLVLASKRAPGASDDRPLVRRLLTAGFTTVLRVGLGLGVSDAHGMKVCRRETLAPIVERCAMRASMFDVEMVLRAEHATLSIVEIPARVFERRPPRTPLIRRTLESLGGVVRLRLILFLESASTPTSDHLLAGAVTVLARRARAVVATRRAR